MLFRLSTVRAVVTDVPMTAVYGDRPSGLVIHRILLPFDAGHAGNFLKRIFYNYFLRDMSVASLELVFGVLILLFGAIFGLVHWMHSAATHVSTPVGTIIIAALSILCGFQLLLAFLNYDVSHLPSRAIHKRSPMRTRPKGN